MINRSDREVGQISQNNIPIGRVATHQSPSRFQDRLLSQIMSNHVRDQSTNRTIADQPGSWSIHDAYAMVAAQSNETWNADQGIRPKTVWIQDIIFNSPNQQIQPREPALLNEIQAIRTNNDVSISDQISAHALSNELVLSKRWTEGPASRTARSVCEDSGETARAVH